MSHPAPTSLSPSWGTQPDRHPPRSDVTSAPRSCAPGPLHSWLTVLPPSAAFSHLTAAGLHGWWLPRLPPGIPAIVDQGSGDHRTRRPGIRVTRTTPPTRTVRVDGLPVTDAATTLLTCARDLALLDLVVVVDCALRSSCTPEEVRDVCVPRRRGVVMLRRALELADARSESPWESVLRVMHVALEAPVVPQHEVRDATGAFVARADLWLSGTRTIHEYDGAVHRDAAQHAADLRRDRALTSAGWTRRGYSAGDVCERPLDMLREIDAALDRRHRPERLRPWLTLLTDSTLTPTGRARLSRRLTRL